MTNRPELESRRLIECASRVSKDVPEGDKIRRTIACIRRDILLDRWFQAEDRIQAQYGPASKRNPSDHSTSGAYDQFGAMYRDGSEAMSQLETSPESSMSMYWSAWKKRWCLESHAERLKSLYNNDRAKYRRAFWRQNDIVVAVQEDAMAAFVSIITRLERQCDQAPYLLAGKTALRSLTFALSSHIPHLEDDADVVFVSIDLEGRHYKASGLTGCGIAKLDNRHFITTDGTKCGITSNSSIPFGQGSKWDTESIAKAVKENITTRDVDGSIRKAVLIGHGLLTSDLPLLQQYLEIDLEECGVVGYIDTCKLAMEDLGHKGTLKSLLELLQIPYDNSQLHSAGHDAYYTMLVLLAMVKRTCIASSAGRPSLALDKLDRLISTPLPQTESGGADIEDEVMCYELGDTFM